MRSVCNSLAIILLLVAFSRMFDGGSIIGPTPVEPKQGSWLVIVEESQDRTAEVAKIVADAGWLKSIEGRGAKFRILDDDDRPAVDSYLPHVGDTRPAAVVVAPDGALLGISTEVTRPALANLLKEVAGL